MYKNIRKKDLTEAKSKWKYMGNQSDETICT